MASDARRSRPVLSRPVLLLLASLTLWLLWLVAHAVLLGGGLDIGSPYVLAPLVLVVGVAIGRFLPRVRPRLLPELVLVSATTFLLASDLYANAQGALGVQLVALSGLMVLTWLPGVGVSRRPAWLFTVAFGIVVVGVLLAARSTASSLLVLVLALVVAAATGCRDGPPQRIVGRLSLGILVGAAAVVAWLGARSSWPEWLSRSEGLSSARHVLWRDALLLWRAHPVTGAGPGTFTGSSELASSRPDLAATHSSVLQVGAELGLVGLVLFGLLIAAALGVAMSGTRAATLVAVGAWTALGVQSAIDHLLEYPLVVMTAGVVLGWGGGARDPDASASPGRPEGFSSSR